MWQVTRTLVTTCFSSDDEQRQGASLAGNIALTRSLLLFQLLPVLHPLSILPFRTIFTFFSLSISLSYCLSSSSSPTYVPAHS